MDAVLRDLVALNMTLRFDVGDYERLVRGLGSHEALRTASARDLVRAGVGAATAARVARLQHSEEPDGELRLAEEMGVQVIPFISPEYPRLLRKIANPPLLLYVQGTLTEHDALSIAIVGSRRASHYGSTQAARLASELATSGLTIVSGFAAGVDTAAHRAALDAGGRTLAVLGSGLARLYPAENAPLADDVAASGAVISEYPLDTRPLRPFFPRRNRIVSGLSLGVLVVEAARRSGALITADWALDQGREVLAVPGRVDRPSAGGCHRLIQQGARLVERAEDVLDQLGDVGAALVPSRARREAAPLPELSDEERRVFEAVGDEPVHIDVVTERSGLPAHNVSSLLMLLELKRVVTQLPGKHFVANP